jgi:uncharacterized protein YqeY
MGIKELIEQDFVKAMKEKDAFKISTLRMVKAAIKNSEIEKIGILDENELIKLLDNLIKKRLEAIELFKQGNRQDLAEKEEKEIKIIEQYLPKALTNEQIAAIIDKIILELKAESQKDFGRVMKRTMEELKGERVDGKIVSSIVKEKLEKLSTS